MTRTAIEKKTFKPVQTVRAARRAYLGFYGLAYDCAQFRFSKIRSVSKLTYEDCIERGDKIQTRILERAGEVSADTQDKVEATLDEARQGAAKSSQSILAALPVSMRFKGKKISELEAEVEALTLKLERVSKAQMTSVAQTAKGAGQSTQAVSAQKSSEDKYAPYIADVRAYDEKANPAIIQKIVNHCGIALRSQDGKFVACSDESERQTVRDSWLVKKLGVRGETAALDAKVMAVCDLMQKDRMKNRVTFYYLVAKNEGLLNNL